MTVERLENEMSASEYDEWIMFYSLEPFGDEERMNDKRNGLLCAVTVNSGMGGGEAKPDDFRMYLDQSKQKIEVEDITEEQKKAAQSAIFLMLTAK